MTDYKKEYEKVCGFLEEACSIISLLEDISGLGKYGYPEKSYEDEVNAFFDKIQTGKNQRINIDNNETCPTCDQYPYSDIDDMCPVCGQSTSKTIEICPIPTEVSTVRISLIDDEKDAILNKEVSLDFPFTINGNELWVFEGDENKAKTNLGIN